MTPSRRLLFHLAAIGAAAVLAGCAGTPVTRTPVDSTKFTVENTDRFVALDAATEAVISCTGLQERSLGDGRLEVVANLRNSGPMAVKVKVECVFLGAAGQPFTADTSWQSLAITDGATEVVRFTAASAAATRYSIRVRAAH